MSPAVVPLSRPDSAGQTGPFRLAVALIGLLMIVVVMGAMTTSTGSGLAFEDWPLSDGGLMPERSLTTLPGFFEHFHRIPAGIAVIMAIGLVWPGLRGRASAARRWALAAAVVIVLQALVGGLGVLEGLPLASSVTHGMLAQITLALFAVTAYLLSDRFVRTVPAQDPAARAARKWTGIALVMIIVQTLLGAIARHTTSGSEHALWFHVGNAFVVFLIVIIALGLTARLAPIPGVAGLCRGSMALLMMQIVLGFIALLVRRGKNPENIEYLWRASLISSNVLLGALLTVLMTLLAMHVRRGALVVGAESARV